MRVHALAPRILLQNHHHRRRNALPGLAPPFPRIGSDAVDALIETGEIDRKRREITGRIRGHDLRRAALRRAARRLVQAG